MTNITEISSNDDDSIGMKALKENMIQSVVDFSFLEILQADDDFIKKKMDQISVQRKEFKSFSENSIKQSNAIFLHADDLIVFADNCQDTTIKIFRYNEEIERKEREQIEKFTKQKDASDAFTKAFGVATLGGIVLGIVGAAASLPLTGGTTVALRVIKVALTATGITGSITMGSKVNSIRLDYQLKSNRSTISTHLQSMLSGLSKIMDLLSKFDSYWVQQINIFQCIILKLEKNNVHGNRFKKLVAKSLASKSKELRKEAKDFTIVIRAVLDRDAMITVNKCTC
ncbi:6357_t:CDS:2 [Funneliformis geosporum]|uniref:18074_t:CDS:1 n=1 Tax=Funneliformis geosporum TaxID=1117311 RepID=A0A9W4WIW8_9GLOM|nr:18074_t:CDS:2 [Funneliformis geosporum]CAI2166547.1 6357_t:CDS:2 [Funneliformis geosporum]